MNDLQQTFIKPPSVQERYHAFDCLRAVMLLFGILMHGVQCYTTLNVYMWPYKDPQQSVLFDVIINWVHMFRMPVFFIMAGFFYAMLNKKRGVTGALINRGKRILGPFVVSWLVLAPVLVVTVTYIGDPDWRRAFTVAATPVSYLKYGTMHLWFLEYLLLSCPLMLAIHWLARHSISECVRAFLSQAFRVALRSPLRAIVFALLACAPQVAMGGWLTTSARFIPNGLVLTTYFLFFAFGWFLYLNRREVEALKFHGSWELLAGCVLGLAGHANLIKVLPDGIWRFVGPVGTWLLAFGFISLFLRRLDRPIPLIRYLSDSSYWLYLIHVPVLIWIQFLLAPLPLPALAKGTVTLGLALSLLILSYQFAVRNTWIGVMLNGKRACTTP